MLKKIFIAFIIFFIIGAFFIGYTDNRIIFTLKNNIPIELRSFLKKTIFFPFNHSSRIADNTKS